MSRQSESTLPKERKVSIWVKLFVFAHMVAVVSWTLPDPPVEYRQGRASLKVDTSSVSSTLRSSSRFLSDGLLLANYNYLKTPKFAPVRWYLHPTGMWQYWDMFSPNPANTDIYGDQEVFYKDGTSKRYKYPRIHDLPLQEKYLKERYRKFFERAGFAKYQFVWSVFAQRIAFLAWEDPNNPPVRIKLYRHEMRISPPGQPENEVYREIMYYEHVVDHELLERAVRGEL